MKPAQHLQLHESESMNLLLFLYLMLLFDSGEWDNKKGDETSVSAERSKYQNLKHARTV